MRRACALLLLAGLVAAGPDPRFVRQLERVTRELAAKGRADAVQALRGVLAELGQEENAAARLEEACARRLEKAKGKSQKVAREAKSLRRTAGQLAATLDELGDAERRRLAAAIVRLDAAQPAAQEALGRVRRRGRWVTEAQAGTLARRAEIEAALQKARKLEFPIRHDAKGHPVLNRFEKEPGVLVRSGGVAFASNRIPPHVLERCVRSLRQAFAVSNFLRGGALESPEFEKPFTVIAFRGKPAYRRWVDAAVKDGYIRMEDAERIRGYDFFDATRRRIMVTSLHEESRLLPAALLTAWLDVSPRIYGARPQACLTAGHVGWISYYFFGAGLPNFSEAWVKERGREGYTAAQGGDKKQEEWLLALAKTGLYGSRSYVRYLARKGADPPWARSMVDRLANIGGVDSMKCLFVAEYLHETGALDGLLKKTSDRSRRAPEIVKEALGEPLAKFEQRWRAWLLPDAAGSMDVVGLLERDAPAPTKPKNLLAHLDALRDKAVPQWKVPALWLDPDLSAGAVAHCRYLFKNKEQLSRWPDAHEEYPSKEGFSIEGRRAGGNGVIVSNTGGVREAVDAWMGTFYHRLPLLNPWLVGAGWGTYEGIAVLDCVSLAGPPSEVANVFWPYDGALDVPRRFAHGELPHPVPGEDQSEWGYPITVQVFGTLETPELEMELFEDGKRKVACHYSTPSKPTNPELAPAGAFCLIPKKHLKPRTRYVVVARHVADKRQFARIGFRTR